MKKQFLYLVLFALCSNVITAQTGELNGKVIDKEYNDILPFANVIIKETGTGTTTDFEGNYSINLDEGIYTVTFSFIGYETAEVSGVAIKAGEVITVNSSIGPLSNQLEEVVVKATTAQNSEASLLNVQKKSVNLLDAISAETFTKIGASKAPRLIP